MILSYRNETVKVRVKVKERPRERERERGKIWKKNEMF